ncbi:MAG: transposase, partial [Rhizobiales bacterium]|nr:transposase [Hyphomicrobiales bacterium]
QLVRLIDGSRIEGPGKTCWRLHLSYDAGRQRIADFAVTSLAQGEKLDRLPIRTGELEIADRAFPQPNGLRKARDGGADVLVRLTWNSLHLHDPATGRPLDWLDLFAQAACTGCVDLPVTVHKPRGRFEPLPLRLVILPKPPEIAAHAQQTARKAASKDQRRIDPRTLQAAEYLILITSLAPGAFPPNLLAILYRVRWQIELAFKRLKSILRLDRLPAKDPDLARTWITAHLLLALLIEDTAAELTESPPCGQQNRATAFDLAPDLRARQCPARRHLAASHSRPNSRRPVPTMAPTS